MTDRERLILEEPEKMCDYCCNFDKEHIGMDGTALCKLTMTLAYAEDYGGNCMFYNVPKEQIIVPPCKVGDKVYFIDAICVSDDYCINNMSCIECTNSELQVIEIDFDLSVYEEIGKTVFLTKEEAEEKLKELKDNA